MTDLKLVPTVEHKDLVQEMKHIIAQARYQDVSWFLKKYKNGNIKPLKATLKTAISIILHQRTQHTDAEFYRLAILQSHSAYRELSFTLDLFMLGLYQASDHIPQASSLLESLDRAFVDPDVLTLLLWAQPDWLGTYIRQELKRETSHSFNYHCLRFLEDAKLITFDAELFALSIAKIPEMQYSYRLEVQAQHIRLHLEDNKATPELLDRLRIQLQQYEKFPLTTGRLSHIHDMRDTISIQQHLNFYTQDQIACERDLPLLLQYESYIDKYWAHLWIEIFQQLLNQQIFQRLSFLQHCIDLQNSHWHKGVKAFFLNIFLQNQPNSTELLQLQPALFALLHHAEKSVLQFAHNQIKPLIFLAEFQQSDWLSWLDAIMMRTDLKVLVKNLVIIFKQLLKQNSPHQSQILALCCDALVQNDLNIQERATDLIVKYAKAEHDAMLTEKLALYAPTLMTEHRQRLQPYLATQLSNTTQENNPLLHYVIQPHTKPCYLKAEQKIEWLKNPHEWLFLLQRYSQSHHSIDAELFLAHWLQLQTQLPTDLQQFLQPVLKHLSDYSFIPQDDIFKQLLNCFINQRSMNALVRRYSSLGLLYHLPFAQFAQFTTQINNQQTLGFLSTPTHAPCFIEPKILLQRLLDYQTHQVDIDLSDFAIALCRMPRENLQDALPLLTQLKSIHLRLLMQFALGTIPLEDGQFPQAAFIGLDHSQIALYQGLWMSVAHSHNFRSTLLHHLSTVPSQNLLNETLSSIYARLHPQHIRFRYVETYVFEQINTLGHSALQHDFSLHAPWAYTLTPLNCIGQDALLAHSFYADPTRMIDFFAKHLASLFPQNNTLNPYQTFILALGLLHQDKTVRLASIQLVADAIQQRFLNLQALAEQCIHILNAHSLPFSRLTDSLDQLKQQIQPNNDALLHLIMYSLPCLAQLSERPKQLKKYLEIYYELLQHFQHAIEASTHNILQQWQAESPSLNRIVQKIMALQGVSSC